MEAKTKQSNIILCRRLFFQDATIGELSDPSGHQICLTMEPPVVHSKKSFFCQHKDVAIPEGLYPLDCYYDTTCATFCFRINRIRGIGSIRLCTYPGQDVTPRQTIGDILVGMRFDANRGYLTGTDTAIYLLMRHHNHLRSMNQGPILEVKNGSIPDPLLPPISTETPPSTEPVFDYDLLGL